jgi:hypothetical protein
MSAKLAVGVLRVKSSERRRALGSGTAPAASFMSRSVAGSLSTPGIVNTSDLRRLRGRSWFSGKPAQDAWTVSFPQLRRPRAPLSLI